MKIIKIQKLASAFIIFHGAAAFADSSARWSGHCVHSTDVGDFRYYF